MATRPFFDKPWRWLLTDKTFFKLHPEGTVARIEVHPVQREMNAFFVEFSASIPPFLVKLKEIFHFSGNF